MRNTKNTYPDPDNTNPTARNGFDVGEAPVSVGSDDGGNQLSDTKGTHECDGWAFHEEESVRTSNEDESLRDHGNLEVDNHVELGVVGVNRGSLKTNAKLVLEESGLDANADKSNTISKSETMKFVVRKQTHVEAVR
jgi:hypothetical protein